MEKFDVFNVVSICIAIVALEVHVILLKDEHHLPSFYFFYTLVIKYPEAAPVC
jgi:hypothetical protein